MNARTKTAYHEAGHSCAALLLGQLRGCVVFDGGGGLSCPTPETAAPAKIEDYRPDLLNAAYRGCSLQELMREAAITAAGCVAAQLAERPLDRVQVTSADARIVEAAARAAIPECDFYVEAAFTDLAVSRAMALLRPIWHRVIAVAAELDRRGILSADDVAALMFPEGRLTVREALPGKKGTPGDL